MSDPAYSLELAIRADEKAKSAHERLDRMNGSIDRLANQVSETNSKIDSIANSMARSDGVDEGESVRNRVLLDSRRFVITTIVTLACGFIGSVATLIWLAASN